MKQFLTPHDIANTIRMMRPQFAGAVMIVEGDSDARVYGRFIGEEFCRIIPAHGKSNVLIAMGILERTAFIGVLAIIDSDFNRLDSSEPASENVLMTDTHDLETLIVHSEALDTVLSEFGSDIRLKRLGKSVRDVLLKAALPIGYLRWISSSKQDNLSLRFKDASFTRVVKTRNKTMITDIDDVLTETKKQSHNTSFDKNELKAKIVELLKRGDHDPWQVCRGHDMIHILTIGLKMVFGNRNAKYVSYEQVDRIMRIAFGYAEFSQTLLYESLKKWETNNPDFRILAE